MTACPAGRTAARPASALVVRLLALTACSGSAAAPVGAAAPVVAPASVTPPQAALVGLAAGGLLDADLPLVVEVTAGTLRPWPGRAPVRITNSGTFTHGAPWSSTPRWPRACTTPGRRTGTSPSRSGPSPRRTTGRPCTASRQPGRRRCDDAAVTHAEPDDDVLSLAHAAEHLGVSPTVLARLLDTGALDWQPTDDVLVRTVRRADLEAHRDARFALQQELAQQARALGRGDLGAWESWEDPDPGSEPGSGPGAAGTSGPARTA